MSKTIFRDFILSANLVQNIRHILQLRTKVQIYKAVDTKCSLIFKAFSSDTEATEQEEVIEMLNKSILLYYGQIMLSKFLY